MSTRIDSIDGLRAVALLGILIVNAMSFSSGLSGDSLGGLDIASSTADIAGYAFVALVFEYKFYPIFAALFGFGMSELTHRWRRARWDIAKLWRQRMLALALLGVANGVLIYYGDILARYAFAGIALWLFSPAKMTARIAYKRAGAWAATALALGILAGSLTWMARVGGLSFEEYFGRDSATHAVYAWGSFVDVTVQRAGDFAKVLASFLFALPAILASMYFGYALHRSRFWQRAARRPALTKQWLFGGLIVGVPLNLAYAWLKTNAQLAHTSAGFAVEQMLATPVSALCFAYGGAWLWLWPRMAQWLRKTLATAGRMALTNYLATAFAMTLLLYGYGWGKAADWGQAKLLCASMAVWLFVVLASVAWQRHLGAGPAERLHRWLAGRGVARSNARSAHETRGQPSE
jgi:uncharacterized protein